jgi:predicted glycogen debranching enzyme
MTSYEGLFLATGRSEVGARLLTAYGATVDDGMLANTADSGTLEHNTADATLWFGHAIGRHVELTGDHDLGIGLLPTLDDIVKAHVAGTRYGIRIDDDGLLSQGVDGAALTWMDARVDGLGVTPRIGKPVEINALWLRTLDVVRELRTIAKDDTADIDALLAAGRSSFDRRFAAPSGGYFDVVDGPAGDDPSLRPNQLIAAALVGSSAQAAHVVRRCAPLLTPLGPRSLAPSEPGYRGRHRGGPRDRDLAYHQGTVWPWLIGPYVDAALSAGLARPDVITGLAGHLAEWGLGSVSETADGDAPHAATGCPFQAWSVAETIRAVRRITAAEDR